MKGDYREYDHSYRISLLGLYLERCGKYYLLNAIADAYLILLVEPPVNEVGDARAWQPRPIVRLWDLIILYFLLDFLSI